jgi:hypothetical protein
MRLIPTPRWSGTLLLLALTLCFCAEDRADEKRREMLRVPAA